MDNNYYTAEEVMKILNKPRSTFYREVEDGTVPSELEDGKRRGRKYPKEAIDAHARLLKKKDKVKLTFGKTTNSELWASYQNHFNVYEVEDIVTYDRLLEWREANENIFMSARDGGKRIGGVTIMPLDEDTILALIDGKIREQSIESWAIRKWSEKNLTVYIPSISLHHTGDNELDRERGQFLIRCAIRWALSLNRQYDIKRWYAIGATPEGIKLLEHLGFEKIEGKRDAYMLKDMNKATKNIQSLIGKIEEEQHPLVPSPKGQKA
ncbi:MAG: helix-turn-helix domain-containing protein [Ktedonobacteraceae bacterium]|nr:helix-turn-helix domain-containing protein [Ktedonobacteraceae bacterium]MBA3825816.1 helix-turn-helix domain-containing protein [Ktedonobacterales bacterium]